MKLLDITERARLVLGVNNEEDLNVKKAYRQKVKQFHPDINKENTAEKMALINEAYDWLNNDIKKENLLKDNKLMKEMTNKDFEDEQSYEEWHKNHFYGYGVI